MSCAHVLRQSTRRTRHALHNVGHRSCRHASTRSHPYPYPTHPNPQPHQIFHLPRSATQQQIKERYYDLVRIYHPDSPVARKYPTDVAQARFQSIARAYDAMRGKSAITGEVLTGRERRADPARSRPETRRRPHFDETAGDERWKERALFGAMLLAIAAFVAQTVVARHEAIGEATGGARTRWTRPRRSLADDVLAEPTEPTHAR